MRPGSTLKYYGVRTSRFTRSKYRWLRVAGVVLAFVFLLVLMLRVFSGDAIDESAPFAETEDDGVDFSELSQGQASVSDVKYPATFPDVERPLPSKIDLTFYTTAKHIGPMQLTAIRSWLGIGASVIIFADNVSFVAEVPSIRTIDGVEDPGRLKLLPTPLPRSLLGAPRLDLIMEAGEFFADTTWVCMINADIVIPRAFGELISGPLLNKDLIAIGERFNCRTNPELERLPKSVNSFEDLEKWSMAPCWPHGSGGKDYFLYRKGYFERHKLVIPPYWIGKYVWDHWLVNATYKSAIDLTPTVFVGHFTHDYDWNWRTLGAKHSNVVKAAKEIAMRDINHNQAISGCGDQAAYICLKHQSTYNAEYQLCGNGLIQKTPPKASHLYSKSTIRVRSELRPKGRESASRRIYKDLALTGSSPSYWTTARNQWAHEHGCP